MAVPADATSCSVVDGKSGIRRRRLLVCTRIHQKNANRPVDMVQVRKFLDGALQYADGVALAVGLQTPPPDHSEQIGNDPPDNSLMQSVAEAAREAERKAADLLRSVVGGRYGCMDKSLTSYGAEGGVTATNREPTAGNGDGEEGREVMVDEEACKVRVTVLPVTPWGNFTPALNALLSFAAQDRADLVLFQSLETSVGKEAIRDMEAHMGLEDLVVGCALPGHDFREGETVELTGATTPWNTLALWDVPKLSKLGFLSVSEGLLPGVAAGVEEVAAIATLQYFVGSDHARAKLVRLPQVEWQTEWEDEGRRRWHESKMASKLARADAQMQALGINNGRVEHIALQHTGR